MTAKKRMLRPVTVGDHHQPMTLLDAVGAGDRLEMLLAQRRLIATALTTAAENTRPQFNNELIKLHGLIDAEEKRQAAQREIDSLELPGDAPFSAADML